MKALAAIFCAVATISFAHAAEEEESSLGAYIGAAGALTLPQGGSRLGRAGGAVARAGVCMSECWAIEASAGQLERYTALGAGALVHFYALDLYDRFFGYSRFDPFFMLGGGGWVGGFRQYGPLAGIGTFWHLDDNWSVRVDASAMLGLDGECEMLYSVSAGLQYSFGE